MLARHGLHAVVEAIARVRKEAPEAVGTEVPPLSKADAERKQGTKRTPERLLAQLQNQNPEQARLIRELVQLYDEGRFLPNLSIAQDFVARRTGQRAKFKSRKAALPALLRVIAAIPPEELRGVRDEWTFNRTSGDYELLARAIMGTK